MSSPDQNVLYPPKDIGFSDKLTAYFMTVPEALHEIERAELTLFYSNAGRDAIYNFGVRKKFSHMWHIPVWNWVWM